MVASHDFAEFLREQLAPLGRVTMRRMFGKTGVFCDGLMLGMVRDNTLYFRVDDGNRAVFKEAESFPPLNYEKKGGTIDLAFWRAPERLFDDPDELVTWAQAALAAARRVSSEIDDGMEQHAQLARIRRQAATGVVAVSDVLGGANFPSDEIWKGPSQLLRRAWELKAAGKIY